MFCSIIDRTILVFILIISSTYEKHLFNDRKPKTIQICGPSLIQMLDMICDRAKELLIKQQNPLTPMKRQINTDDNDPFAQTLSFKDHTQFDDTLIGDCCLRACTLRTLLKYC